MNDEDKKLLDEVKAESEAKQSVIKVINDDDVDLAFKTKAIVQAKLKAYKDVVGNLDYWIVAQAKGLKDGTYKSSPGKELGLARLVTNWIILAQEFIERNEALLEGLEPELRRKFMEESFEGFDDDIKALLLTDLNEKRREVLVWFERRLAEAEHKQKERDESRSK